MTVAAILELDPEPRSVRRARVWISDELQRIGRPELCDAAELGISELVTNALLHSEPPIVVRLAGTEARPRVEVQDASVAAPTPRDMTRDGRQTATVGRGLGIVATFSRSWGSEVLERGKIVWFEPLAESEDGEAPAGDMFDLSELLVDAPAAAEPDLRPVRLRGLPIPLLSRYQVWFEDLHRELRMLVLTDEGNHPLARELVDVITTTLAERQHYSGIEQIEAAMAEGCATADVDLEVPVASGTTMDRLRGLLERADQLCRDEETLTLPPDEDVVRVRAWYHGEFTRQLRGEPPRPWPPADGPGSDSA